MIDTLGLRETLGEAAIYTCLAPTDEHVQAFVQKAGYQSLNEVPKEQLEKFVNYHFINGMYYAYDLEKRYLNANSERSEEHTSELQSLMRISYAVFCLKKTRRTFIINITSYTSQQ